MATEYCLIYTYTGQTNTASETRTVEKSKFTLTGDTGRKIGKVTRIVYKHAHSSTNSPTWELKGRLHFANGSYIDSDTQSHAFSSDVFTYTNTFTDGLPSASAYDTWTKVETIPVNSPSGELYWRATTAAPMTVEIYFIEAGFMYYGVDGDWKECEVYYGVDGGWKQVTPHYGVDGTWKST